MQKCIVEIGVIYMAKQTTKHGFEKPEITDGYDIRVQNANWDKVDDLLPQITCGTEELEEGTSELATGSIYFVYE